MSDEKREMTPEGADKDFKSMFARVITEKVPGSYVDGDGYVCVPTRHDAKVGCEYEDDNGRNDDNNPEGNGEINVRLCAVTKSNNQLSDEFLDMVMTPIRDAGWNIQEVFMGKGCSDPALLVGEIRKHIERAVIFAMDESDENPRPMYFVSPDEVGPLVEALDNAGKQDDPLEICKTVHASIRS